MENNLANLEFIFPVAWDSRQVPINEVMEAVEKLKEAGATHILFDTVNGKHGLVECVLLNGKNDS